MPSCSSNNCELIVISFKKLMYEIENSELCKLLPNRTLTPFYLGKIQMLVDLALIFPISRAQVDEVINSISPFLQNIGGIELLVPLAAQKGSRTVRDFLFEALLEPGVKFPISYSKLIIHLENLAGGKLENPDHIARIRKAGFGDSSCLKEYQEQMI